MDNILKHILTTYKIWTAELLERLYHDKYEAIEECFTKRQECIDKISKLTYEAKQFAFIANELNLLELEKQVNYEMNEKRAKLKDKIDETSRTQNANRNYNKNIHQQYSFFNTKV